MGTAFGSAHVPFLHHALAHDLIDDAAQAMARQLNQYGASRIRAEIMQKRSEDNQTLYEVKLVFPRGDATSLLFGFDVEGKSPASPS